MLKHLMQESMSTGSSAAETIVNTIADDTIMQADRLNIGPDLFGTARGGWTTTCRLIDRLAELTRGRNNKSAYCYLLSYS